MKNQFRFSIIAALIVLFSGNANAQNWLTTGNAGPFVAGEFLGTTGNDPLIIKTSGAERIRIIPGVNGFIGINNPAPLFPVDLSNTVYLRGLNIQHAVNTASLNTSFYSTATNTGAGATYGYYSDVPAGSAGNGNQGSFYGTVAGNGSGSHYGLYTYLPGQGNGVQRGVYNDISNTGEGAHYGVHNLLRGAGPGIQYGTYNSITNTGAEKHYGIYSILSGSGAGNQYGNYSTISNTGAGTHYGNYVLLSGAGTGLQYGSYTSVTNTSNLNHYGSYVSLTGTGSGNHYGYWSNLTPGTGQQYGYYSNISNTLQGACYGVYTTFTGTGGGSGTRYGVYSNATGSSNYAFYGNGRGYVSEQLGVGTSAPSTRLHVQADAGEDALRVQVDNATKLMVFNNGGTALGYGSTNVPPVDGLLVFGDVGIGTTTPDAKLNVKGDGTYIPFIVGVSGDVKLQVNEAGDVSINTGTVATGFKLSVDGKIVCEELKVQNSTNWPDYVFADNYKLLTLDEVEKHIMENKHLPGIPSACDVEENGIIIGDMQKKLMVKVEELTLYIIELKKQNQMLSERLSKVETGK